MAVRPSSGLRSLTRFPPSMSRFMSFIPASPFYGGALAIKMLIGWLVIGCILFLVSGGQRRGLSEAELEEGVFGSRMGG